jgi:hypothetical protein
MKWTKEEIDYLNENYTKYGLDICCKNLNRTKRAIQLKRKKLKIETKYSVKDKWQEENLKEVVNNSKTHIECLRKLRITNFGSSYNTLFKYIKKYDIDDSHLVNTKEQITNLNKKIDLCLILVEKSKYSTNRLKKRLYEEGLKERICEMCGQGEEWNDKHMSLILDHINGINNDNRIENLRIVCPNCNATLDTHCRGHKNKD